MPVLNLLSMRRLRQQWQRLRLTWRGAGPPRIREFYTSDFVVLDGALCKVFWKVENAWRLTLEPVPVPSGYARLDVTGRIFADIVADARHHTLYLHADGVNGQRVSQLLDLRPLPVNLRVPRLTLRPRRNPVLPLQAATGRLRLLAPAGPSLPGWHERPAPAPFPHWRPAGEALRLAALPSPGTPALGWLPAALAALQARVARVRQAGSPAEVAALRRELPR